MSVFAVENYVQSILDDLASPNMPAPTQAWVAPPPVVQLTPNPQVFVWGGAWVEVRHTMPRPVANKRVTYQLAIYLQAATTNDPTDAYGPSAFPVLIETVLKVLRTVTIPIPITDSVTGDTSIIQTIGEENRVRHPTPVSGADQRMLWHNASITTIVTEELTPA